MKGAAGLSAPGKIGFASGAVAVASAAMLMTGAPPAQGPPTSGGPLIVCAGADQVLRAVGAASVCVGDDKEVRLDRADSSSSGKSSDVLADLERRLADLEQYALFEVVDEQLNRVFAVAPGAVRLYNTTADTTTPVAVIRATDDGGWFTASSPDNTMETSFGISAKHAGVWISENGVQRVELGKRPGGNYALRILSDGGAAIAAIGQSVGGSGVINVADQMGTVKASIATTDGRGELSVLSARDGQAVVVMNQSRSGEGLLTLADAKANAMVKMAVTNNRYGAVLTGPAAGSPLMQSGGLPGSYFFGCSGGEACR